MKIQLNDSHFILLGVTRHSTKQEIKNAYRNEIKKWHPDKFANTSEKYQEALERTKRINEAFELLENYDPPKNPGVDTRSSFANESRQSFYKKKAVKLDIPRVQVKSSNLYSVGYDRNQRVLQIEFRSRAIYQYYNVPEIIFLELIQADSKGRYFHANVLGHFTYESV